MIQRVLKTCRTLALSVVTLGLATGFAFAQSSDRSSQPNDRSKVPTETEVKNQVQSEAKTALPQVDPAAPAAVPPTRVDATVYVTASARPDRAVLINAQLPAQAEVWIGNQRMTQTGPERLYISPPLPKDKAYYYDMHARWLENGVPVERHQRVFFRPGDELNVSFLTQSESAAMTAPTALGSQGGTAATYPGGTYTGARGTTTIVPGQTYVAPGGGVVGGGAVGAGGLPLITTGGVPVIGGGGLPLNGTALNPALNPGGTGVTPQNPNPNLQPGITPNRGSGNAQVGSDPTGTGNIPSNQGQGPGILGNVGNAGQTQNNTSGTAPTNTNTTPNQTGAGTGNNVPNTTTTPSSIPGTGNVSGPAGPRR